MIFLRFPCQFLDVTKARPNTSSIPRCEEVPQTLVHLKFQFSKTSHATKRPKTQRPKFTRSVENTSWLNVKTQMDTIRRLHHVLFNCDCFLTNNHLPLSRHSTTIFRNLAAEVGRAAFAEVGGEGVSLF